MKRLNRFDRFLLIQRQNLKAGTYARWDKIAHFFCLHPGLHGMLHTIVFLNNCVTSS